MQHHRLQLNFFFPPPPPLFKKGPLCWKKPGFHLNPQVANRMPVDLLFMLLSFTWNGPQWWGLNIICYIFQHKLNDTNTREVHWLACWAVLPWLWVLGIAAVIAHTTNCFESRWMNHRLLGAWLGVGSHFPFLSLNDAQSHIEGFGLYGQLLSNWWGMRWEIGYF